MSIDIEATQRVMNARVALIDKRRFYGVLVSHVEPVLSRKFPTMATDGKRHYFNPEFVMGLSKNHLGIEVAPERLILGVQAHESEHDARHHGTRRNGRDPVEWNICCDYSINIDLIDEGFDLPEGALIDPKYRGMSAEDIFRSRELDKEREKPEEPQDQENDDGEAESGLNEADTNPPQKSKSDDKEDGDDQNDGDESGDADDGDEQGDDGEGDSDGDSDEAGDEGKPGKGQGGDAEGDDGEGEGTGNGGDAEGDEGGEDGQGTSSGDPGVCGEVLDSVGDEDGTDAEEDVKWERVVRQAASMAKAVGQLPGHISREIERANNPPRDWRDELREFCEQGGLRTETWNRPNRRFMGRGFVLPSTQKDGVSKAVFIIDTSGSCDAKALACVQNEAQAMLDDGIIDEVVAIYGDTRVTRVDEYMTGDEIEFDPRGGGGTDMQPLFQHVAEAHDDATLIVCFTDLEFYKSCGEEPHCPVLFAVHGYPQQVKALIDRGAPWGAAAIDVGAH